MSTIDAATSVGLQPVIGLEVHAQLKTRTKLFCGCENGFGGDPNTRVCPVCLGLPGALPRPNQEAIRLAVRFVSAIDCQLHRESIWARKNYFYPDLPKGYQISQYERPLATDGTVIADRPGTAPRAIRVARVHLEEDAGKSVHEGFAGGASGVDLNRCGVPLIEIVSAPEIDGPELALAYLERLRSILRVTGVCDGDMEKGLLRCDANVSLHRPGEPFGTRVEIKNLNSFRFVRRALLFEIERQAARLARGEAIVQETRLWDEASGQTRSMRGKEEAEDYRYFPDPDLRPLEVDDTLLALALADMPERPDRRRLRYQAQLGLPEADAARLTIEHELGDFFEAVLAAGAPPRAAANWVLGDWLALRNEQGLTGSAAPVGAPALAGLIELVTRGVITGNAAKRVFATIAAEQCTPSEAVERLGLSRLDDTAAIAAAVREVLDANPAQLAQLRAGKQQVRGFLIGQVMKRTGGRADPAAVRAALDAALES